MALCNALGLAGLDGFHGSTVFARYSFFAYGFCCIGDARALRVIVPCCGVVGFGEVCARGAAATEY